MAIMILSAKEYGKKLKATIQASGKLGFTEQTAEELRLGEDNVGIKFGKDGEKLYLIRVGSCDEDAFKDRIGETVSVIGDSPFLEKDLAQGTEGCIICSGSAVLRLLRAGMKPAEKKPMAMKPKQDDNILLVFVFD